MFDNSIASSMFRRQLPFPSIPAPDCLSHMPTLRDVDASSHRIAGCIDIHHIIATLTCRAKFSPDIAVVYFFSSRRWSCLFFICMYPYEDSKPYTDYYFQVMDTMCYIAPAPADGSSPIDILPNELLSEIFLHICHDAAIITATVITVSFWSHNCARDVIRHTCSRWRQVANAQSTLWTKLYIGTYTLPTSITAHVSHLGRLPVDVRICLDTSSEDARSPVAESSRSLHLQYLVVQRCLKAAKPSVHL
jgi:hypothetical protein